MNQSEGKGFSLMRTHYGEKVIEAKVPEGWNFLGNLETRSLPRIGAEQMVRALDAPIGTAPAEELARGKNNAVIVSSDVTRPVEGEVALPILLNRLNRGGIPDEKILLIMGGGSHTTPRDLPGAFLQKFGKEVMGRVRVQYHNPDDNLVQVGQTRRGHLVEINRWVMEADLKIGFGGIIPHAFGGYSGGAKVILPGVASREAIIQNHVMVTDPNVGTGLVEGNPIREEMEEAAEMAGLDFILNLVLDTEGKAVGAVSGDFRRAYRAGVAQAGRVFQAELPRLADVIVTSGHPYDIHLYQSLNGPGSVVNACKNGGTIIHLTPAHQGILENTRKLFSSVKKIGYRNLFDRLRNGERSDEAIRSFFFPEINIGLGMIIFRSMIDRNIKIVVVTEDKYSQELTDMGFGYAASLDEAMEGIRRKLPEADVAAALNAKVLVTVASRR